MYTSENNITIFNRSSISSNHSTPSIKSAVDLKEYINTYALMLCIVFYLSPIVLFAILINSTSAKEKIHFLTKTISERDRELNECSIKLQNTIIQLNDKSTYMQTLMKENHILQESMKHAHKECDETYHKLQRTQKQNLRLNKEIFEVQSLLQNSHMNRKISDSGSTDLSINFDQNSDAVQISLPSTTNHSLKLQIKELHEKNAQLLFSAEENQRKNISITAKMKLKNIECIKLQHALSELQYKHQTSVQQLNENLCQLENENCRLKYDMIEHLEYFETTDDSKVQRVISILPLERNNSLSVKRIGNDEKYEKEFLDDVTNTDEYIDSYVLPLTHRSLSSSRGTSHEFVCTEFLCIFILISCLL